MTIRSISVIGAICGFVRYVSTTMIVRLRMNKPVIVVGSLQSHAVVVYVDRGGCSFTIRTAAGNRVDDNFVFGDETY